MLTDGLMIAMLASLALLVLGYKLKALPIVFISSLGWVISGLQLYEQTTEILPVILLLMLAVSQFFVIREEK